MKELNSIRLLAGIPIDASIEITEKTPVTESQQLLEAAKDSALNDFWVVRKCDKADCKLSDVLQRTNTQGLAHAMRDADDDGDDDLLIFAGTDKVAATKEAKKRIRATQKAAVEAEEEMFFKKAEQEYEEECEYTAATSLAPKGDGQVAESMDDDEQDFEPKTNICPDCMEQGGPPDPDCERCDGHGEIFEGKAKPDYLDADGDGDEKESMKKALKDKKKKKLKENKYKVKCSKTGNLYTFTTDTDYNVGDTVTMDGKRRKVVKVLSESMHTYDKNVGYGSWVDDEDDPVNVADGSDAMNKKSADKSHDAPEGDKDESPTQLDALDTPSQQDQSGGGDLERKVTVPAAIKKQLKDEAAQARKEAKTLNVSNREASYFYEDLATMFDDLHAHLDQGTVRGLKDAAVFMTSLMGPMLHKIPADVVNFIAKGGKTRSLKSYMTDVSKEYPIVGPRNALS